MTTGTKQSPGSAWARRSGYAITGLTVLFLLMDAGLKLARLPVAVSSTAQLGWPETSVAFLGILLLVCTALYCIPRTSILGAILLTGYLGGAVATHARIGSPLLSHTLFGVYVGIAVWAGLYLRSPALRSLLPISQKERGSGVPT